MTDDMKQPTCGQGLAWNSILPEKLGALAAALAGVLAAHMQALDLQDVNSKQEYEAYKDLVRQLRQGLLAWNPLPRKWQVTGTSPWAGMMSRSRRGPQFSNPSQATCSASRSCWITCRRRLPRSARCWRSGQRAARDERKWLLARYTDSPGN
jgi:hypothetical protein